MVAREKVTWVSAASVSVAGRGGGETGVGVGGGVDAGGAHFN